METSASTKILEPLDCLDLWQEAWAARDADKLAGLFAADAEFVNVVGLWWHNQEDIRRAHAYGFDVIFGKSEFGFTTRKLRTLSENTAVVHGKWWLTGQNTPTGRDTQKRRGIFTFVLQKHGLYWLVVAAQNTDIVPGAESIAVTDGVSTPVDYR